MIIAKRYVPNFYHNLNSSGLEPTEDDSRLQQY